jgi:hypothetical protein
MRSRCAATGLVLACAVAATLATPATPVPAQQCSSPTVYPGDAAPREAIAAWMAQVAVARGIPGELPVMASLVESGLKNLDYGDADSAGFFAMRVSIWNTGEYAGFPDKPELQLEWFLDQAEAVRARALAQGDATFGQDPSGWGEWIADVERPAAQNRGRYQLRLEEARALIVALCQGGQPDGGMPSPPLDETAPPLTLRPGGVRLGPRALSLTAGCPVEQCTLAVAARILVRRRPAAVAARAYRLRSAPRTVPAGARATVRLRFGKRLRSAVAAALRAGRPVRARLRVEAADAAGNVTVARRALRLLP